MKLRGLMTILLSLSMFTLNPPFATAERFAALYVGGSFTTDHDLSISSPEKKFTSKVNFDDSFTLGYRMGYWFETFPEIGLALEASYFRPNAYDKNLHTIDHADLYTIPVSALLMFRRPLMKSNDYPKGQLLPYVGVGPAIFFSKIEYEVESTAIPGLLDMPDLSGEYSDQTVDIGLDLRVGIKTMFGHNRAVFLEYRFTKFGPDFEVNVLGNNVRTETDIDTHHVLIGLSCNF